MTWQTAFVENHDSRIFKSRLANFQERRETGRTLPGV
jgi:hypothetical protein